MALKFALLPSLGHRLEDLERVERVAVDRGYSPSTIAAALFLAQSNSYSSSDAAPFAPQSPTSYDPSSDVETSSYNPVIQSPLTEVEDDRIFHPDVRTRPFRRVSSKPVSRFVISNTTATSALLPYGISPSAKAQVITCIRRKARRAVILALGHGGGKHRKPRYGSKSDIWC